MTAPEYRLLVFNHWSTCTSKSEWSGWAHAIGSILAIAIAGVLLYLQLRASRRHAIEAEKRLLLRRYTAISAVAEFAEAEIRHICSAASALCQVQVASLWIGQSYRLNLARGELETVRTSALDS